MTAFGLGHRRTAAIASCVLGLSAGAAVADTPPKPLVLSSSPILTPPPHKSVEIYYGTTKVVPAVAVTPKLTVVEPPPRPRVETPVYVPLLPASLWGTGNGPGSVVPAHAESPATPKSPINVLAHAALQRILPQSPSTTASTSAPTIVVLREPATEPRPLPVMPATPNVVVVREPAVEASPIVIAGVPISPMWLGSGIAIAGLTLAALVHGRAGRISPVLSAPAGPPHDPVKDGPLLMGKYKVGPLPEPAETFQVGPTYADEVREKQRQMADAESAVVAHILAESILMLEPAESGHDAVAAVESTPANTLPLHDSLNIPFEDDPAATASAPIPV